jgi:hypothetical protein
LELTEIPKTFFTSFTGDNISRETKGIANATKVSEATVVSSVIVATV